MLECPQLNLLEHIEQERTFLESQRTLLERMEGWENLTRRQQAIILISLKRQKRAERGTDEISRQMFTPAPEGNSIIAMESTLAEKGSYSLDQIQSRADARWQNFVTSMCCHRAVNWLEHERLPKDRGEIKKWGDFVRYKKLIYNEAPLIPREGGHRNSNDFYKQGFLVGIHHMGEYPFSVNLEMASHDTVTSVHSCVALGELDDDILIWEKDCNTGPFQLTRFSSLAKHWKYRANIFLVRSLLNKEMMGKCL